MKSTVTVRQLEYKYPKLMKHNLLDYIALFVNQTTCMIVASIEACMSVGDIHDDWLIGNFTEFTGQITLEN